MTTLIICINGSSLLDERSAGCSLKREKGRRQSCGKPHGKRTSVGRIEKCHATTYTKIQLSPHCGGNKAPLLPATPLLATDWTMATGLNAGVAAIIEFPPPIGIKPSVGETIGS